MTDKPKRRFWHHRFNSMIVFAVGAALILIANLSDGQTTGVVPVSQSQLGEYQYEEPVMDKYCKAYGWPWVCFRTEGRRDIPPDGWELDALCKDIAVALAILIAIVGFLKCFILRENPQAISSKPTRRFWQFHLSTALALMLFSGGVLGANILERGPLLVQISDDVEEYYYGPYLGWPWPFMLTYGPKSQNVIRIHNNKTSSFYFESSNTYDKVWLEPPPRIKLKEPYYFNDGSKFGVLALNVLVCGIAVLGITVAVESAVRRQEGRKTQAPAPPV